LKNDCITKLLQWKRFISIKKYHRIQIRKVFSLAKLSSPLRDF
jgi:hypothetical protein